MKIQPGHIVYLQLSSRIYILLSNLTHPHTQCTYVHVPHTTKSCLYQTFQLLYLSVNMSILPPTVIFLPSSGASSFFYVCSVNKDTLAKVGISRTLGNKNCIAFINRNIQIWIQMNETSKKKIGSISRCLDPHLDRHEKPYTYAYKGRMLCTWNTPISMSIYLNS